MVYLFQMKHEKENTFISLAQGKRVLLNERASEGIEGEFLFENAEAGHAFALAEELVESLHIHNMMLLFQPHTRGVLVNLIEKRGGVLDMGAAMVDKGHRNRVVMEWIKKLYGVLEKRSELSVAQDVYDEVNIALGLHPDWSDSRLSIFVGVNDETLETKLASMRVSTEKDYDYRDGWVDNETVLRMMIDLNEVLGIVSPDVQEELKKKGYHVDGASNNMWGQEQVDF